MYRVTASDPKIGSAVTTPRSLGQGVGDDDSSWCRRRPPNDAGQAAELKKSFEEGVTASRAGQHDAAIEKFQAALVDFTGCFDCQFNIGVALMAKKDEKARKKRGRRRSR
jgi:hypothetical protein